MSILIAIKRGAMGRRSVVSPMSRGNVHGTNLMLVRQQQGQPFQQGVNAIGYGLRGAPGGGPGGDLSGRAHW